jgi:hypothetical protein
MADFRPYDRRKKFRTKGKGIKNFGRAYFMTVRALQKELSKIGSRPLTIKHT